ncbi:MAG TPA: hypothetical protein VMW42_10965, partial [Desulfatiglandales bacterium]|nr:hypothetical protein [Desulfatiglandales bacterium]
TLDFKNKTKPLSEDESLRTGVSSPLISNTNLILFEWYPTLMLVRLGLSIGIVFDSSESGEEKISTTILGGKSSVLVVKLIILPFPKTFIFVPYLLSSISIEIILLIDARLDSETAGPIAPII